MQSERYVTRRGAPGDGATLKQLFDAVFKPEEVGALAQTLFEHHHRMGPQNWFIAQQAAGENEGQMVAAFALIPWMLELEGVALKVAEMGIVGTLEAHRGQGLMRGLNEEFDRELKAGAYDLAMIQGIPGFYSQFGYNYALPLENHINVPLHTIPARDSSATGAYGFRLATTNDIPFLLKQDALYRQIYSTSCRREEADWRYLLTTSRETEYGSEFWIMSTSQDGDRFYLRIPQDGFGNGLIASEVSDDIDAAAMEELLLFCSEKAVERDKPYIRLNLHNEAAAARLAIARGSAAGEPYAWQMKIPDPVGFLQRIAPVLNRRLSTSLVAGHTGTLRLNLYRQRIDLVFEDGALRHVHAGVGEVDDTFSIAADMFPALCLGHRSWSELRHVRPDTFPSSARSRVLVENLFPPANSWIHEQY